MEFTLKIVADLETIEGYLRGIFWGIFFTRAFGSISAVNGYFFDVPYPKIHNCIELENLIETNVSGIVQGLLVQEKDDPDTFVYKSLAVIKFYEKIIEKRQTQRQSSSTSLLKSQSSSASSSLSSQYVNCWETWYLKINVINNRRTDMAEKISSYPIDKRKDLQAYKSGFESNLLNIIEIVDENKEHIPLIHSMEITPFPYRVLYADNTHDSSVLSSNFAILELNKGSSNSIHNSTDTSLEYIMTTETGDVIMGNNKGKNINMHTNTGIKNEDSSKEESGNRNSSGGSAAYSGEELLRNGYKYIKKLLSE